MRSYDVRYRGLAKNTARVYALFALANLYLVRHQLRWWRATCLQNGREAAGPGESATGAPRPRAADTVITSTSLQLSQRRLGNDLRRASLTVSTQDSAGVRIIQLSRSMREVARALVRTTELEADLVIAGVEEGFGHLADVTTVPDNRIMILNRMEKTIWLYDHEGERLGSIGREGKGATPSAAFGA